MPVVLADPPARGHVDLGPARRGLAGRVARVVVPIVLWTTFLPFPLGALWLLLALVGLHRQALPLPLLPLVALHLVVVAVWVGREIGGGGPLRRLEVCPGPGGEPVLVAVRDFRTITLPLDDVHSLTVVEQRARPDGASAAGDPCRFAGLGVPLWSKVVLSRQRGDGGGRDTVVPLPAGGDAVEVTRRVAELFTARRTAITHDVRWVDRSTGL